MRQPVKMRRKRTGAWLRVLASFLLAFALCAPSFAFADEAAGTENANAAETESSSGESASSKAASGTSASSNDGDNGNDSSSVGKTAVDIEGETNTVDPAQRADNSFIRDTTIESLFSDPSLYEGRTVQVVGEAIGDIVSASPVKSKYCWVTLTTTDETNPSTISVLLSNDQANQIDHLGRYGVTGTILQVRGTYHQACSEHEGIPDIHVIESSAIERGIEHPDLFELSDYVPGTVAIVIGLVLMGVYYIVRERTR